MDIENNEQYVNYFDASILDYKEGTAYFEEKLPEVTKAYMKFTEHCFEPGKLNQKEKQLIALGISVYAQDEYCIMYHTKGAVEHGATEEEIAETIGVCAALGGGAAFAQGVTLAMETYHHYANEAH
ncbi:AhpD family alkylhydroperoxidase [Natronobacillus azotifigens]|uniref:Carboxymuconolactone decarboxylase family protein n=1 Tax=Natronobacillus azotifigens TaxID=472978 RepID=A0A9J6RBQ5_9BACI|nr:carboxymuconolactone decarboxylase family protein [Natronobacillus azotifigens]MCZ0702782.1 carboxymuconolactone decarboxylase family protein [Natronobacillus azotifigens]